MRRTHVVALALLPLALVASPATAGPSTASATVFSPNPVATLQDEGLTDQKDADYAALQDAYRTVTLTHLDGSGYLHGDYASVDTGTGPLATAPFTYHRDDDRFEQVMAYYWATQAQLYLHELGFTNVNNEPQRMKINQYGVDNSYYNGDQKDDVLRFGKGGVDDAEDAEVILHEYGHAIQDSQVPGFGTSEQAGAIGEGFGDYWAQAVSTRYAPTKDEPCIADWDSVSYTDGPVHCLRRTDGTKSYPTSLDGEVHDDGEIWSSALNGMRTALGPTKADTAIIRAQFSFAVDTTMPAAAQVTIATVKALYGSQAAPSAKAAFHARGLA
ncbi:MAG: Bacillolysin [Frankiales bacterium]|nr:Bacillolysin [Frankiales bacterium]